MQQRSDSFRLEFEASNMILRLIVDGAVTGQFLLDGYVALQKGRARFGACVCIVDYTGATDIIISPPGVRQLVAIQHLNRAAGSRETLRYFKRWHTAAALGNVARARVMVGSPRLSRPVRRPRRCGS
jgi:hypothetical protein